MRPLTPLQILWINFAVDVLLAIGLGFDAPVPGLMQRKPRDASAPIVHRALAIRLGIFSFVDGRPRGRRSSPGARIATSSTVATTMGLTTLSLMHIVAAVESREPTETIFKHYTIENRRFMQLIGAALALTFLVTTLSPLQRIFDTVPLTSSQWGICLLGPILYVALVELSKLVERHRESGDADAGRGGGAVKSRRRRGACRSGRARPWSCSRSRPGSS